MRKIVSHTFVTLDGVGAPDAVIDAIVELRDSKEVLDDFFGRMAEEDAMLLGRVTYEEWADHWPASDSQPFANHINTVPKYVFSSSLEAAPWGAHDPATVVGRDDLAETVSELKQQPGGNIGVHGSLTLVEVLLHADLLDEMRLEVYPVIAGTGKRLFNDGRAPKRLRLADSRLTSNGVAILSYERAGP
jgi:dihydrofolate reductase